MPTLLWAMLRGGVTSPGFCCRFAAAMNTSARRARAMIVLTTSIVALAAWPSRCRGRRLAQQRHDRRGRPSTSSPPGGVLPASGDGPRQQRHLGVHEVDDRVGDGVGDRVPRAQQLDRRDPHRQLHQQQQEHGDRARQVRRTMTSPTPRTRATTARGRAGAIHADQRPQRHRAGAESQPRGALRDQPDAGAR